MKKTVIRVISLLIAVVMLVGMALPSLAYYIDHTWIDDYSDFPGSEFHKRLFTEDRTLPLLLRM